MPRKQSPFLFRKPVRRAGLTEAATCAFDMAALFSQLVATSRTRVIHRDGRAENIAEHSFMLAKIAPELAAELYPALDENLVARFALLHDDIEAYMVSLT